MLKKLSLLQMMLITELMQGGDLGTKLRSDRETPRKTGWYRQGCYYALGVARSGANPFALHWILSETACCLASGCLPEQGHLSSLAHGDIRGSAKSDHLHGLALVLLRRACCRLVADRPERKEPCSPVQGMTDGREAVADACYGGTFAQEASFLGECSEEESVCWQGPGVSALAQDCLV